MAAMGGLSSSTLKSFFLSSSTAKNPEVFFASKQKRYGSIFKTHKLGCPCVMMSSPEAAKLVLLTKSHLFKLIFPSSKERMLGKQAIFFSRGQYHAKLRKLVLRTFMPDATVLTTLANSGITVVVALPNELLASIIVETSGTAAETSLVEKSINMIRFLSIDAVKKANSGHPGLPMGCAPMGHILYDEVMSVREEDLKNFRQWGSRTHGHPENFETPRVEVATRPLGQGIANAVELALAEKHLAARFKKPYNEIVDHYTYVTLGDSFMGEL